MSAADNDVQEPLNASDATADAAAAAAVVKHDAPEPSTEQPGQIDATDDAQSEEAAPEILKSEHDEPPAAAVEPAEEEFMTPMTRNRSLVEDEVASALPPAVATQSTTTAAEVTASTAEAETTAADIIEEGPTQDKGKGRADDDDGEDNDKTPVLSDRKLEGAAAPANPPSPVDSARTVTPPPEIRYALPIGGGRRSSRRRSTLTGSKSGSNAGAGPSNSAAPGRRRTVSGGSVATIKEAKDDDKPSAESIITEEANFRTARRMSASDIPRLNEDDEANDDFVIDADARKRAHTVSVRSRNDGGGGRPATAPATQTSFSIKRPGELHKNATSSSLASFMIDGQMFTLGDEKRASAGVSARSTHARSEAHGASYDDAVESSYGHGVMLYDSQMRNPVAATDEPMIYDEEDLDDVPPQGSYAIHPPSRRRLAEASELSLYDEEGTLVRFGTLFETQRTLIVFLRHWFCPFCQMFAQSIQKLDPLPLQRADLGMVVIGQGHWHVTKSYKEVMKIPSFVRMFADPSRKIYTALGMTLRTNDAGPACTRPDYQTMGVLKASLVAIKKGVVDMPIRMPGDVKLLGGEFILGPGLQCSFTHRMVTTRGHLDLPRVLSQAGCDLTLKTPKDVLAERDSVSKRRPQSTRSVDRNTARRIAKRIARKARPTTPKDALLAKSQRAAAEAAGQDDARFSSLRGVPPPLPKTMVRSISKRFGGSSIDEGHMAGVDSATPRLVAREAGDEEDDVDDDDEESSAAVRARKALSKGMQTGFSRTVAASSSAASKARRAAQSIVQQQQTSSANGITSEDTEWTDETPKFVAPPLPRTSSQDAYEAAAARHRTYNEEMESLRSDAVVGNRADGHRSTASLGRSVSLRGRRQQAWQRRYENGRPLTGDDPSLSSPDLHLTSVDGSMVTARTRLHRSGSNASQSSTSSRRDVPITLPMGSAASSASSHTMTSSVDSTKRTTAHGGVPLSVFEHRIKSKPRLNVSGHGHSYSTDDAASLGLAISPRKSSMRYQETSRITPLSPSISAPFGEDTDYKRLSKSKLEDPAMEADERTPKSRTVPLHNDDDANDELTSAHTSRDVRGGVGVPPKNRVSIMALLPHPSDVSPETEAPPPVPPKSPPRPKRLPPGLPSAPSQESFAAGASASGYIPGRAPMPAPTSAFASVFASEAAIRNKSQASVASAAPTVTAASNGPSMTAASPSTSAATSPTAPVFAGARPLSFAGPALFAGVPSLRAASSVPAPVHTTAAMPTPTTATAPQESPELPSEPATPTQERPFPPTAPVSSGNPLQAFALKNARSAAVQPVNASAILSSPPTRPNGNAASFLDDLETVDGFRRSKGTSDSNDSALAKSPNMTSSVDSASNVDYDDDEDDDDGAAYSDDWAPLQARHNAVPAQPKSSSNGHAMQERNAVPSRGLDDDDDDEEDLDWSESDTQDEDEFEDVSEGGGSQSSHTHQLALLGVLSEGRRGSGNLLSGSSNGNGNNAAYVVKRVTSRPVTAPLLSSSEHDSRSSGVNTVSASARKVQLNAVRLPRKPQTADANPALSNANRRLTSFREEEEEEQQQ